MHNIPDDCASNPLAPWNEKRVHPGQVFELAAEDNFDALDHIADHAKLWLGDEVVARCFYEAFASLNPSALGLRFAESFDSMYEDCNGIIGVTLVCSDSWLAQVARQAIGESIKENWSGRELASLLVACAQAGKGKLSPEFPRDEFDKWQDDCQESWERDQ